MYNKGDKVWLKEIDNGEEVVPRMQAMFLGYGRNGTCTVEVKPENDQDDGLRELLVDDVEELVGE
jgi:hypothetical protein